MWTIMVKDWRENWLIYVIYVLGTVFLTALVAACSPSNELGSYAGFIAALVFTGMVILVSASLVAGEKARGTLPFLLALPVRRVTLWSAKATSGLLIVLILGLLLFGIVSIGAPGSIEWLGKLFGYDEFGFEIQSAFLFLFFLGFFCSIVCERVMTAMAVSCILWLLAMQGFLALKTRFCLNSTIFNVLFGLAICLASLYVFSRGDFVDRKRLWKTSLTGLALGVVLVAVVSGAVMLSSLPGTDLESIDFVPPDGIAMKGKTLSLLVGKDRNWLDISYFIDDYTYYMKYERRLCLIDLESSRVVLVPERYIKHLSISPDGQRVVFTSLNTVLNLPEDRFEYHVGGHRLYRFDWTTAKPQRLEWGESGITEASQSTLSFDWSPDRDTLAVAAIDRFSEVNRIFVNLYRRAGSRPVNEYAVEVGKHNRMGYSREGETAWSTGGRFFYISVLDYPLAYSERSRRRVTAVGIDTETHTAFDPLEEHLDDGEVATDFYMRDNRVLVLTVNLTEQGEKHIPDDRPGEAKPASVYVFDMDTRKCRRFPAHRELFRWLHGERYSYGAPRPHIEFTGETELTCVIRHLDRESTTVKLVRMNLETGDKTELQSVSISESSMYAYRDGKISAVDSLKPPGRGSVLSYRLPDNGKVFYLDRDARTVYEYDHISGLESSLYTITNDSKPLRMLRNTEKEATPCGR